jgi:hypothetical protein
MTLPFIFRSGRPEERSSSVPGYQRERQCSRLLVIHSFLDDSLHMKIKPVLRLMVLLNVFGGAQAYAQGTFANLDFESPILPLNPDPFFMVPTSSAVPHWTVYIGNNPVSTMVYNTVNLGAAGVSLQSSSSIFPPIQGNYSVILQPSSGGIPTTAAIAQTGEIPSWAKSLIFYGAPDLQASFQGASLGLTELDSRPAYDVFAADISAFAGQTGEMRFTMPNLPFPSMSYLDNIQFSSQPVPEPGTLALGMVCAALFAWNFFRTRKRVQAVRYQTKL